MVSFTDKSNEDGKYHDQAKLIHVRPSAARAVRDPVVAEYDTCREAEDLVPGVTRVTAK